MDNHCFDSCPGWIRHHRAADHCDRDCELARAARCANAVAELTKRVWDVETRLSRLAAEPAGEPIAAAPRAEASDAPPVGMAPAQQPAPVAAPPQVFSSPLAAPSPTAAPAATAQQPVVTHAVSAPSEAALFRSVEPPSLEIRAPLKTASARSGSIASAFLPC